MECIRDHSYTKSFDKNIKVARINSHYLILMKNPQGLLQIKTLASHLFPGKTGYFFESYNNAVENHPYGYLVINMRPNSTEDFKLSTNIFPGEQTTFFFLYKDINFYISRKISLIHIK